MTDNQSIDRWLERFAHRCATRDSDDIAPLFDQNCRWRDMVAFTWNIKTIEGLSAVGDMMAATLGAVDPVGFERTGNVEGVGAWFTFETKAGRAIGHVTLEGGKCKTLFTALKELKGFEEAKGATIQNDDQPYCLIIGGGQCGVALAARLKQLNVPSLVVEKNERAGDNWRKRYASLTLHDPVHMDHFPYIPFPEHYPTFMPKDMLANFIESYVQLMGLNYWTDAACKGANYDEASGTWTVTIDRGGEEVTLNPAHVILAIGMSGFPNQPKFEGQDIFKGEQQHSSEHPGPEAYRSKKCVVVGSNNSAHDIAEALVGHGADVTMLQRSPTTVVKLETFNKYMAAPLYSAEAVAMGIDVETADKMLQRVPIAEVTEQMKAVNQVIAMEDAAQYESLKKAGFRHDFGPDGAGIFLQYLRSGGGYYIDVGASQRIIDGEIKLVVGQMTSLTKDAVVMEDGTEIAADLVVYATGYGPMSNWVEALMGKDTADKIGPIWGLEEGELRNMWKPTPQDNFWVMAGSLGMSRQYSHYLALQLKARYEGLDTPVY